MFLPWKKIERFCWNSLYTALKRIKHIHVFWSGYPTQGVYFANPSKSKRRGKNALFLRQGQREETYNWKFFRWCFAGVWRLFRIYPAKGLPWTYFATGLLHHCVLLGPEHCKRGGTWRKYIGTKNETISGKPCQPWLMHLSTRDSPFQEFKDFFQIVDFPDDLHPSHNFCRHYKRRFEGDFVCWDGTDVDFCEIPDCWDISEIALHRTQKLWQTIRARATSSQIHGKMCCVCMELWLLSYWLLWNLKIYFEVSNAI